MVNEIAAFEGPEFVSSSYEKLISGSAPLVHGVQLDSRTGSINGASSSSFRADSGMLTRYQISLHSVSLILPGSE